MKQSKPKTVKMKFSANQYYVTAANKEKDLGNPLYFAGKVYEVEEQMVARWLKRGGVIVGDIDSRAEEPAKVEDADQEQVEDGKEKEEDVVKSEPQNPQFAKTSKAGKR